MLRLRKTRWKTVYLALSLAVVYVLNGVILAPVVTNPLAVVAANLVTLLLYFGGVRSFRGAGEPIKSPRAWWRMTSRPRAGFVIGTLLALSVASGLFLAVSEPPVSLFSSLLGSLVDAALAFLYLRSSLRLRREPPPTVPELPRWKPLAR